MAEDYRYVYSMPPFYEPEDLRPTAKQWFKHGILFFLTLITSTIAGILFPLGSGAELIIPDPVNYFEWIFIIPFFFAHAFASVFLQVAANPTILFNGLAFSLSLLAILTAHEGGHYVACRLYGVKATLPYFIPLPFLSPAGTLGAVIKIQAPMPSRRAVFDIGVAGPLAGFAVIVPIAILGLATIDAKSFSFDQEITFGVPLLMQLLGGLMNINPAFGIGNPFYSAAWVGTLVTALNLIPAGQLDGGHTTYSVLGERAHYRIGRVAFVGMVLLTILGYELYNSPSALVFTILLAFLLRVPHPQPLIDEPLDNKRVLTAIMTLIVFILSFMPFPVRLN